MSKRTELADAIATLLNDTEFSMNFEARRKTAPLKFAELEALTTVAVCVFVGTKKTERRTRGELQHTYKPVVSIQRKLDGRDEASKQAHVDELVALRDEIEDALATDLADLSFVSIDEEEESEPYNAELMQDLNVFAGVIIAEYTD